MDNVLVIGFDDDRKAYEALTSLKQLDEQGQIALTAAAVVARTDAGQIEVKDQVGNTDFEGTASGGVLGLLIGVIGGPLGVLLGGAYGALVGSLFDAADADDTESALSDVSRTVRPGQIALLAEASEQSPEVADNAMATLGGTVTRRSVYDVQAEIAAAQDAQEAAASEARKQLREQRRDQAKAKVDAKLAELKTKLHRQPVAAGHS
jgi:uncharacterized membrane protein